MTIPYNKSICFDSFIERVHSSEIQRRERDVLYRFITTKRSRNLGQRQIRTEENPNIEVTQILKNLKYLGLDGL